MTEIMEYVVGMAILLGVIWLGVYSSSNGELEEQRRIRQRLLDLGVSESWADFAVGVGEIKRR